MTFAKTTVALLISASASHAGHGARRIYQSVRNRLRHGVVGEHILAGRELPATLTPLVELPLLFGLFRTAVFANPGLSVHNYGPYPL